MNRKIMIVAVAIFMLLFVAQMAFAQDPTPTPNFPPVDIESDVGALLTVLLTSILGAAIASPIVATLVGILKLIKPLNGVSAELLTVITAAVVYVLAAIATRLDMAEQFYRLIDALQAILPILLTLIGAPIAYVVARKVGAPVIGFQRTGVYADAANVRAEQRKAA